MVVREGYKQTEIGVIPEDWDVNSIEEVCTISTGDKNTQDRVENGKYPFFVRSQTIERINSYTYDEEAVLTAGDGVGTGKVFHYINGKFDIHQRVYVMTDFNLIDGYFFYHYFSNNFYERISQMTAKSSVDSVRREMIANMRMPVPPKDEQKAIAKALSDVDALMASLEQLISKKQLIKQCAMQELLTGKRRLPGFEVKRGYKQTEIGGIPEDWEVSKIDNVCMISTGDKNTQDRVENGRYPFFVRSQTIERINSYTYDEEAVLTAGDGVGTGKIFHYINGKFDIHQRVYVMNGFHSIDGYFFYLYFSNNFYERIAQMTAKSSVDSVRREMIANMLIPIPAEEEQKAIATILSDMDTELEALETKLEKTKQLKEGMMHELLTGRIRLI